MKTKISKLLILIFLTMGCSSDNEGCNENIGPIPCEDFNAVTPPLYGKFLQSYETLTTANPQLLNDEIELAKAIFDDIKAKPVDEVIIRPLFDLSSRMCEDEWKLCLEEPIQSYTAMKASIEKSLTEALDKFPQDAGRSNTKADGFRRAYWALLMAEATDAEFAALMVEAHQTCDAANSLLSLHNSGVGIDLLDEFPTATSDELIDLLLERRYEFVDGELPDDIGLGIVFNTGRQKFDATYVGSLTNPDINRTWDCTLYLYQVNNIIRGEYLLTFNSDFLSRRFSGMVTTDGMLAIDISFPYAFELSNGIVPCENAKATFVENRNNLTGPWTSTTPGCSQGGEFDVDKVD